MPLPTSGSLSLDQIHVEAGGTSNTTCSLNDPDIRQLINKTADTSNGIVEYRGASRDVTVTFELIGGGGAGGYGMSDGGGTGNAASGGTTTISGSNMSSISGSLSSSGGSGGANGTSLWNDSSNRAGQASYYGAGGAGGADNSNQPGSAPAASAYLSLIHISEPTRPY